jgi:hypothetical protein
MQRSALRVLVACLLLLGGTAQAQDGDLRDFITDLYGGDGIVLPPAGAPVPSFIAEAHQAHFQNEAALSELSSLSDSLLSGTQLFALNSTVTGVAFDLSTGIPQAVQDGLGPLLSERAKTVGKGRLTFGFGFAKQKFDELDGESLSGIEISLSHVECCGVTGPPPPDGELTGFEEDEIHLTIDVDIEQDVYALYSNFGVTDNFDIGIVVPVVRVEARATSFAEVFEANPNDGSRFPDASGVPVHTFDPSASDPDDLFDDPISSTGGSETGIGDVVVRGKWAFLDASDGFADMALALDVTLPTGSEKKLLGTGETQFRGTFIASKQLGRTTPHVNVGYSAATSNSSLEKLTYAVGFDTRLNNQFTFAADVLGRYNPHVKSIGNHIIDLAVAAKWNPFSNRNMPLNAFVSFPLNDDGLRADFVWGIGFDVILN